MNSREELTARDPNASSRDERKILTDVMGANTLTYPNIISKVESADEILDVPNKPSAVTPQLFDSSFMQAGRNQKGFGPTTLNQCSSEVLISHCAYDLLGAFLSNEFKRVLFVLSSDMKMTFIIGSEKRLSFEGRAFECIYFFRAADDGLITPEARTYVVTIVYVSLLVI